MPEVVTSSHSLLNLKFGSSENIQTAHCNKTQFTNVNFFSNKILKYINYYIKLT